MKALFRAAGPAILRRDDEAPKPEARRRGGEKSGGALAQPVRASAPAARGRYAALRLLTRKAGKLQRKFGRAANDATADPEPYVAATAYLAETLEWLNLWEDNAHAADILDDTCDAAQNQCIPQP